MAPVIHGAGAGLAGLMLYVTHDVGSKDTADRVAWTAAVNLPVDEAESCRKLMQRTVNDAADLKAAAGMATTGRKLRKPFEHLSLSWSPGEHPTKREMMAAALEALHARGYSGCQAFIACHTDCDHPHVHIVVCRVDPQTGRTRKPTHARKLQRWAEDYEERTGGIRIPNRRERRLVREHNAEEIRAAMREERQPALRRMPPLEPKRVREPNGKAIRRRTAGERQQWSARLADQETAATPAHVRAARAERVNLNRDQADARIQTRKAAAVAKRAAVNTPPSVKPTRPPRAPARPIPGPPVAIAPSFRPAREPTRPPRAPARPIPGPPVAIAPSFRPAREPTRPPRAPARPIPGPPVAIAPSFRPAREPTRLVVRPTREPKPATARPSAPPRAAAETSAPSAPSARPKPTTPTPELRPTQGGDRRATDVAVPPRSTGPKRSG